MKFGVENDAGQFVLPIASLKKLAGKKRYKMIDIGAGKRYIKKFLPKNIEYNSLDFQGEHDILFNLDSGKLPIKSESYDIILCLETLEHTLHPMRIMKEIVRIAKPRAIFLLSMPNDYNFYCRFNFLLAKKTLVQEPFQTVEKNLHIHTPRSRDILEFFSQYVKVVGVDYPWYSRTSAHNKNLTGQIFKVIDSFIRPLSKINPSLFSRCVVIKGVKK
ncbi:MAG: methyltransferase domain-containing protein [archaeon]